MKCVHCTWALIGANYLGPVIQTKWVNNIINTTCII